MKLRLLFLGVVGLSLSACLKAKTETHSSYNLSAKDKAELRNECTEMFKNGDINSLLNTIKMNRNQIMRLLELENFIDYEKEISRLADSISEACDKVKALGKPEWNFSKFDRKISWTVDQKDFKNVFKINTESFSFDDVKVLGISLSGQKRTDLEKNISMLNRGDYLQISYTNKASALELCQLEKTLMIVLEVKHDGFIKTYTRYFNLIINDEK